MIITTHRSFLELFLSFSALRFPFLILDMLIVASRPVVSKMPDQIVRKLVTVRRIDEINDMKNRRQQVATVGGWRVIVPKEDMFHEGDLVVFFEIDSFLPWHDDRFWEYTRSRASQTYDGTNGYVVQTTLQNDVISQGLILRLTAFPEINADKRAELLRQFDGDPDRAQAALMELDHSVLLGVKKFEEAFESDTPVYGQRPIFFPQPGCERVQNVTSLFEKYGKRGFHVTEKLDGVPMTIYNVDKESQ